MGKGIRVSHSCQSFQKFLAVTVYLLAFSKDSTVEKQSRIEKPTEGFFKDSSDTTEFF